MQADIFTMYINAQGVYISSSGVLHTANTVFYIIFNPLIYFKIIQNGRVLLLE